MCVCLSACLSVTTLAGISLVFTRKKGTCGYIIGFSRFGFLKNQKLWREQAIMQKASTYRDQFSPTLSTVDGSAGT